MRVFDWFKRKAEARTFYELMYKFGGVVYMNDTPKDYIDEGYRLNSDVYSIVSRIAAKAAEAQWTLFRKTGMDSSKAFKKKADMQEVENHELYKLLWNPNPYMTLSQFIETSVGFRLLVGNNYILKFKPENGNNSGKIVRLEVLPAHFMGINAGEMGIESYQLNIGQLRKFSAKDIIHIKTWNPDFSVYGENFYGQSPLRAGRMLVTKSNDSFKAAMRMLQNQGVMGILASERLGQADAQQPPDNELVRRLQEDLQKNYSGPEHWGKKIVSGHPWKWIQLGMSAVDMALIESEKLNTKQICNLFKFPPELLGDQDAAKYNSMKEARKALVTDAVVPELRELRDSFNSGLISQVDPDLYLDYSVDHLPEMQEDMELMSKRLTAEWWWTPNEKREMSGREPLTLPGMDTVWKPMAVEPLGGEMDPDVIGDELKKRGIDEAYN